MFRTRASGLSWKSCRPSSEFREIQTLICKEMCKKLPVLIKSFPSQTDGPALISNTALLCWFIVTISVNMYIYVNIILDLSTAIQQFRVQFNKTENAFFVVFICFSGLNIEACPGHVHFVPGHIDLCGYMPDWARDFSGRAHDYFSSSIHQLYRASEKYCLGTWKSLQGMYLFRTLCLMGM